MMLYCNRLEIIFCVCKTVKESHEVIINIVIYKE